MSVVCCGVFCVRYHYRTGYFPQEGTGIVAKLSGDHIPLGGFVRAQATVYQNDLINFATRVEASTPKAIRVAGRPCQAIS
jgi:hypothetical protein